jgi:hypothetical protein
MPDSVPPSGPARDAIRRFRASVASAAGLDEMVTAFQTARAALRPLDQVSPAGPGGRGSSQNAFASVPHWPAHRWVTTPMPRTSPPGNPNKSSGTEVRQPVRTGELTFPPPITNGEGEDDERDDTLVAVGGSAEPQPLADVAGLPEVESELPPTFESDQPIARLDVPVYESASEIARSHDRWHGATQLITRLLAGEELGALLRTALKLSVQSFGVDGALIHLREEYGALSERVFALGEPAFEATLRATARRAPRGASLTSLYPHRLIVPIPAASGTLGEFYLFRSALRHFTSDETEDARSFTSTLAIVLEHSRLRQQ